MKKQGMVFFVCILFILIGFQYSKATKNDYYRTYEIVGITENGLTLKDSYENVIEVDKDTQNYKVGYKVRYDRIRKRLRLYRWQDYKVIAVEGDRITILHKSGDTLTVEKRYSDTFEIGDIVRYDSVDKKLQAVSENQIKP